jgi:hypothetical protein
MAGDPMLSDWERRQWRSIERALAPAVVESTHRARRRAAFGHAMFPAGYLGSALLYTLCALGGAFLMLFLELVVVGLVTWMYLEYRIATGRGS